MHERKAKFLAVVLLMVVLVPLGFFVVEYIDHRESRLSPAAAESPEVAQAEPVPDAPEDRYVPPAPITYPFY